MKLTKKQALLLIRTVTWNDDDFGLYKLKAALEDYLTRDECDEEKQNDVKEEKVRAKAKNKENHARAHESYESQEEAAKYEINVSASELNRLEEVRAYDAAGPCQWVMVGFFHYASGGCAITIDGCDKFMITHVIRDAKRLHVLDIECVWRELTVNKFPSAWVTLLPVNELVEVVA